MKSAVAPIPVLLKTKESSVPLPATLNFKNVILVAPRGTEADPGLSDANESTNPVPGTVVVPPVVVPPVVVPATAVYLALEIGPK